MSLYGCFTYCVWVAQCQSHDSSVLFIWESEFPLAFPSSRFPKVEYRGVEGEWIQDWAILHCGMQGVIWNAQLDEKHRQNCSFQTDSTPWHNTAKGEPIAFLLEFMALVCPRFMRLSHKQPLSSRIMHYSWVNVILPSTTCNNIPINQSDLRDKFTVYVNLSLQPYGVRIVALLFQINRLWSTNNKNISNSQINRFRSIKKCKEFHKKQKKKVKMNI